MACLGVVSTIAADTGNGFIWRYLAEKFRQHGRIARAVVSDLDGTDVQRAGINGQVYFAPLAPVFGTVLFTLPFAFTQELDAGAVDQQIQCRCAGSVRQLNAQVFLAPAHGAEVWHPPVQARQAQQTFDQPQALTQGQSEQAFDAQAELDCRIGEGALTTTFAADSGVPLHVLVQPNCQGTSGLE